jgi:hypothetical protein
MPDRRIPVFFYGLFMDLDALRSKGVHPTGPQVASVAGYAIRIGQRATLWPASGSSAHGLLMNLTHAEIELLYSAPGLEAYRPEAVAAAVAEGPPVAALCFNLVAPPAADEANPVYAATLRQLASRLALPPEYVQQIR